MTWLLLASATSCLPLGPRSPLQSHRQACVLAAPFLGAQGSLPASFRSLLRGHLLKEATWSALSKGQPLIQVFTYHLKHKKNKVRHYIDTLPLSVPGVHKVQPTDLIWANLPVSVGPASKEWFLCF